MPKLIKSVTSTYIPGDPGQAYIPATIAQPGYWSSELQYTCTDVLRLIPPDYNPLTGTGGLPVYLTVGYNCVTSNVLVYHPATAGSDGIPYAAPTPAQINVSLNVGWNSYASSIGKLDAGKYLDYSIKMGTTGALLAVGYAGLEGEPIGSFTHGLMTDVSSISVFESGVVVATLATNQPTTKIRIARLTDGRIVYGIDTGVFHVSTAPAYLPSEDLYVYGMLYSGYDEVSSAAFVAGDLLSETSATISGVGSLTALVEQFVEASIGGAGTLIASPYPSATLAGAGTLAAWAEQFVEASIGGTSSLWVYAETSYPTTAYLNGAGSLIVSLPSTATLSGVGSLIASPYPTATLDGVGTLTASTSQMTAATLAGLWRLVVTEAYQGQLTGVSIAGASGLIAFADVGGRGYGELPAFVGLGGDTKYGQGHGDLPYFVSGTTNGQSGYVPAAITRGYGNLPMFVGAARGVDIGIGTATASLPVFVGVAGDYSYGFGSGSLPMFVGAGYGGFIPDDMLVLISPILGTMPLDQQIDLVLILNSSGELSSSLTLTREQALELMSTLQQSDSFAMLGVYAYSMLSSVMAASLQNAGIGSLPDLDGSSAVWVVNIDTQASSQYDRYGFNSFIKRNGVCYGVAPDGIYRLDGATDAGAQVEALAYLGRMDFATALQKLLPNAYLGASSTDKLKLEVDADGSLYVYETRDSEDGTFRNHRVDLGRGLKANMLGLTVKNKNGADFKLATVDVLQAPGGRRI